MSSNSLRAAPLYSLRRRSHHHLLYRHHYLSSLSFPTTDSKPHTSPFHFAHRRRLRRPSPAVMSSGSDLWYPFQLDEESDFERIVSPDGLLSVCGFGSLLSERSARSTFPDLIDFRVARLNGFRRVFAHVAPIFFERGIANPETKEISSLSVEPCEGETLIVTLFSIKKSEILSFIEREHEFRFLAVLPESLDGIPFTSAAVLCARFSDEEYLQIRCKGSQETYFKRYGRYNIHKIWRDDILPCRVYLRHCVLAAKNLGHAAYGNFLDHTFLGDRKTTIREYLVTTGSGIMEEEPPEPLKTRYGG
ncbi:Zinc finger protein [Actinidia chinensis var. chinensis]|uniref:Zinc finger protein n=1 Tax=Actinidia chinensis var. chinensis TaxID=1590841 RepID=A0A2R6PJY2_ACTCC|nr:Zinc finger protein [Actinidia chinensis var. chinensis]